MATAANTVHKLQKTQYVGANNTMVHNSDVIVRGNLTIVGGQTYAQTSTLIVKDNIITLNAAIDQSGIPLLDAGIEIDRGSEQNVALLWKESEGAWKFTNDGVNYETLGGGSAGSYANSAFAQANAAFASANNVAPQVQPAFDKANAAYNFANTTTAWGTRQTFVATAGQTAFSVGSGYLPGSIDVYYNGIKLYGGEDYIANDGINITLSSPATVNSIVEVVGFGANVPAANVYVLNSMTSLLNRQTFFANNGQTVFTPTQRYRVGYVDVYYNGLKLNIPEDVTANDGTDIVFVGLTPTTNDVIEIVGLTPNVALANAIPITGGTISGGLNLTGNVIPTTDNTYYLGSSTNRWHSLFVGPGSIDLGGLILSNSNGTLAVAKAGQPATPLAGEDTWVRAQANAAFAAANNVAPQIQPAFDRANAAFAAANSSSAYGANTNSTNFFALPVGTTAQRPANPANGSIRLNTTSRKIEVYIDNYWANITSAVYTVDYLVVAGGGGSSGGISGVNYGAGGAGGTVRVGKLEVSPGVSYTISVGAGGTGGGSNGSSSNIKQTADQTVMTTAGGGSGPTSSSFVGGRNDDYTGGPAQGGVNVGGGAGGAGSTTTGNGGPAYVWPFNGISYAGGGGGGQGGSHGGGGYGPNTGGGAQGQGSTVPNTAGGSGIVIITYPGPTQRALGGTVTTSNGYYFHTFTGSGTFTA